MPTWLLIISITQIVHESFKIHESMMNVFTRKVMFDVLDPFSHLLKGGAQLVGETL